MIDVRRLRRDQIVFVNKSEDGSTEVYSLYDFKDFRENMDAEKGYIQGRFDAVPYVDSSVEVSSNYWWGSYGEQREKAPDKRMRRIALVICEGETEENYLNLIRKWYKSPVRIVSRIEGTRITQAAC